MDERRIEPGRVGALDDAALQALAFGPGAPADIAAAARAELLRRRDGQEARPAPATRAAARRTSAPAAGPRAAGAPVAGPHAAGAPVATAPDPADRHDGTGATGPGDVRGGSDAPPILPSASPDPHAPRSRGRRPRRGRAWRTGALVLGTAVVAGALGVVGTVVVGRLGPAVVQDGSSDSGSETLTRVLARDQTAEDRLPSTLRAPVDRSTARLLFANYADRPPVPWAVWVVRARSGGDVCLIASPDRYATDVTCLPSRQALRGHVSYTTRDGAQGLAIRVDGGVARIDLIGGD